MQIRHTRPEDVEAAAALVRASWISTYASLMGQEAVERACASRCSPELFRGELGREGLVSYVALDEAGKIVGHAMAYEKGEGQFWLERLHIAPEQYGSGLAEELLNACMAAGIGHRQMGLSVVSGNDRAIAFYRKHGFEVTEAEPVEAIEGTPLTIMCRAMPWA